MTFEGDGAFVLLFLLIPAGLFVAFATAPRWAIRSMSKHAMWRLRDDVVDDSLVGRLPQDHPAVQELIGRIEWAITEARSFDLIHLWVWMRARRNLPRDSLQKLEAVPSSHGLTGAQAERVTGYRRRYNTVAIRALFLSSWIGIAVILRYGIPVALDAFRHRTYERTIGFVVWEATKGVESETNIGRSAREFVTDKGPDKKPALV